MKARTTTSFVAFFLLILFTLPLQAQVIFDGINCNSVISAHGTGDEWGAPHAHDSDGVNPISANLQGFWSSIQGPYLYVAFSREGPGNVGFAMHMNIDCDTSTGNTAYKGADYALFFSIQTGVVQDSNMFIWDTTLNDYVTTGTYFEPRIGGSTCLDSTDEEFFELRFRLDDYFDMCDFNCNTLSITQANIHSGASFSSVIKDELALDLDMTINESPTSGINADSIVCVGDPVSITGSNSSANGAFSANGDTISVYEWDLSYDSDSFRVDYVGPSVDTIFMTADTHTIALRVYDMFGCVGDIDTFVITSHRRPSLIYNFMNGSTCLDLNCYSGGSIDHTGANNLQHFWDMGDGNNYNLDSFTHWYDSCKFHTIRIIVTDPDNPTECASDSVTISSVLPADILDFTAYKANDKLKVRWTVDEKGSSHYELYRSYDAENYSLVASQKAGDIGLRTHYYEEDWLSVSASYFTLEQVEWSGERKVYGPVAVYGDGLHAINSYPNPARDLLTVNTSLKGQLNYKVLNALGQQVLMGDLNKQYNQSFDLKVGSLPSGWYVVEVENEMQKLQSKFYHQ